MNKFSTLRLASAFVEGKKVFAEVRGVKRSDPTAWYEASWKSNKEAKEILTKMEEFAFIHVGEGKPWKALERVTF